MRRQEILHAAREVFARKGYNDATLDDVAERAEFGKGTLYNYFPNKESLFLSVIEDAFDVVKQIAIDALSSDRPFSEKVDMFIRGELTFFFNNLESVQLMMREAHHMRGGNPLMQLMPQLLSVVADTISAEQKKRKILTGVEPTDLAVMLINMLFGQFTCRIYRRFGCMNGAHEGEPTRSVEEMNMADLFQGLTKEDIDREIDTAAKLVHTVYFQGISR